MSALRGRNVILALLCWAPLVVLAGCLRSGLTTGGAGTGGAHPPASPPGTEPIIIALNLVAWGGILAAVGVLIASAWLPVPKATAGTLVLAAIGAWALKILLVKLWWLVLLVAVVGAVAFVWHWVGATGLHLKGQSGWLVGWLERRTGKDLNESGTVGT